MHTTVPLHTQTRWVLFYFDLMLSDFYKNMTFCVAFVDGNLEDDANQKSPSDDLNRKDKGLGINGCCWRKKNDINACKSGVLSMKIDIHRWWK